MAKNIKARLLPAQEITRRLTPAGSNPRMVLLVGLPASGKSTFVEGLTKAGFACLSLDAIRAEIYGDAAEQGDWRVVRKRFDEMFDAFLAALRNIVIDNTNFDRKQRKRIIDKAVSGGLVDIHLILLDVPLAECLRRNRARARVVKEDVIRFMHEELYGRSYPTDAEGVLTVLEPSDKAGHFLATGFAACQRAARRRK